MRVLFFRSGEALSDPEVSRRLYFGGVEGLGIYGKECKNEVSRGAWGTG